MAETKKKKDKKEYGTIPIKLILTQEQLDACSTAAFAAGDEDECVSNVGNILNKDEKDILAKGYEPDHLSFIIGTALYPKVEQLKKEGRLSEDTEES